MQRSGGVEVFVTFGERWVGGFAVDGEPDDRTGTVRVRRIGDDRVLPAPIPESRVRRATPRPSSWP